MAMVQMLVDFGAEVNARDYSDVGGYTPLHYAVQMNNYEVRAHHRCVPQLPDFLHTAHSAAVRVDGVMWRRWLSCCS